MTRPPRPRPPYNPAGGGVYIDPRPGRPVITGHRLVVGCWLAIGGAASMLVITCLWPAPWWVWAIVTANAVATASVCGAVLGAIRHVRRRR